MNIREMITLLEEASYSDDALGEAMWWVQRYVSGSLTDPDWEDDWLKHVKDVNEAVQIVHRAVGNRMSVNKPLYRALDVTRPMAQKIQKAMVLPPYGLSFQSFTTSEKLAIEVGEELSRGRGVLLIVEAAVPADRVLFGMRDLKRSKIPAVGQAILPLADWFHQDEVLVSMASPLPLTSAKIV